MGGNGDRNKRELADAEAGDCAGSSQEALLAEAAMTLLGCRTDDDVYRVAGEFMAELCPGAFINVNEITPDLDFFITRGVFGADGSMLSKGADLIGFEMVGKRWAILPAFRDKLITGTLCRIPEGFSELAANDIPRPVAAALTKAFGVHELYAVGIADRENARGNITILTRTPDAVLPTPIIESFAHHCYSVLASNSRARELAESAESNRLMLRNMAEGLALHEIILDERGKPCDYRYLDVNPAFEELMGLRAEDLVGHTVLEIFPDIEPSWIEAYGDVAMTGAPARFEGSSGSLGRLFDVSAYSPRLGQFASILSDITERSRSRAALAASEAKFSTAFRTSPDAVNINRMSDGLYLDINEGFTGLTGYTADDVVGKTSSDIRIWVDIADRERLVQGLRADGVVHNLKARFRRKDGSLTTALMSARTIEVEGEMCILSVTRDISDLEAAEQAVRESEDKFKFAFDHSVVANSITSLTGEMQVNAAFCEMLGYKQGELADKTTWMQITHPDDVEFNQAQLEALLSGEKDTVHFEKRYIHKDGSVVWADIGTSLRRDDAGEPLYFITTVVDVTERERAMHTLRESERWLSESQHVAHLGHYIYDIQADHWDCSPALLEVFGIDEGWERDFGGWLRIAHPDEREMLSHYFPENVIGKRQPFDIEYRIVRPADGVERWVHGLGTVEFADDGHPIEMFGIIQDTTERRQTEDLLARSLASIIEVVGRVVETRDPYTAGHQQRVSELAASIASEMGMSVRQVEEIRISALIHDVGKMSVPAEILSKPGKLSSVEFELIKTHSETGYQIVSSSDMEGPIAEIVYQHHERCDGSGYPRGLHGSELLDAAKIIMVADVVEAMSSHRPYRAALGIGPALAEIARGAGTVYDASVAEACRTVIDAGFAFSTP